MKLLDAKRVREYIKRTPLISANAKGAVWLDLESCAISSDRDEAMMLNTDGCGGAYCPKCGEMKTEYHVRYHSLDGVKQRYCSRCGQRLIWDIDWSNA